MRIIGKHDHLRIIYLFKLPPHQVEKMPGVGGTCTCSLLIDFSHTKGGAENGIYADIKLDLVIIFVIRWWYYWH